MDISPMAIEDGLAVSVIFKLEVKATVVEAVITFDSTVAAALTCAIPAVSAESSETVTMPVSFGVVTEGVGSVPILVVKTTGVPFGTG